MDDKNIQQYQVFLVCLSKQRIHYHYLLITPFLIKPISKWISAEDLTCSLTITEYEKDKVYIKLIEPWRYDVKWISKYYNVIVLNILLDDYLDYDITSMSSSFEREEYYIGNIYGIVVKPTQRPCTYTYDKDTIKNEKYITNIYL